MGLGFRRTLRRARRNPKGAASRILPQYPNPADPPASSEFHRHSGPRRANSRMPLLQEHMGSGKKHMLFLRTRMLSPETRMPFLRTRMPSEHSRTGSRQIPMLSRRVHVLIARTRMLFVRTRMLLPRTRMHLEQSRMHYYGTCPDLLRRNALSIKCWPEIPRAEASFGNVVTVRANKGSSSRTSPTPTTMSGPTF